jgi:hypothetical protein
MTEVDGTLLWTSPHGLRCVVVPYFGHCQLRLLRNLHIVKTEVFDDTSSAVAAAKKWRRLHAPSQRALSRAARVNHPARRRR